ncbi:MAG: hypothetical protein LUG14_08855 [Synergistaceae bacterium]|nr:hypothetical protein [Synergistaceae bacterium]MCD8164241.1 hypothetical protein [Synergistaceae bacterium]
MVKKPLQNCEGIDKKDTPLKIRRCDGRNGDIFINKGTAAAAAPDEMTLRDTRQYSYSSALSWSFYVDKT